MLRIPAIRGEMGGIEYFLTRWGMGEAARNLTYSEELEKQQEAEVAPDMRTQRRINWPRVRKEIVPYLLQVPDHFFSSLTVEVVDPTMSKPGITFEPVNGEWGYVVLDGTEELRTLDGQHRLVAIKEALRENPGLAVEQISVILIPFRSLTKSQQLFSDLNRNAKPTTKTTNVLFEWRGLFEQAAKQAMNRSQLLKDRVELERNSLAQKSKKVITLGVLYEMAKEILKDRDGYKEGEPAARDQNLITRAADELVEVFDEVILPSLPDIEKVLANKMTPFEHRSRYIATHSVGWQGIAGSVRAAIDQHPDSWKGLCREKFSRLDWRINNPAWEGTAVAGGLVANRAPNIRFLIAQLKEYLGLTLSAAEEEYFTTRKPFPIKRLQEVDG